MGRGNGRPGRERTEATSCLIESICRRDKKQERGWEKETSEAEQTSKNAANACGQTSSLAVATRSFNFLFSSWLK